MLLKELNKKPNKIWVGKGCEFYNSSVKEWLKNNNIEMYQIHNEENSVVDERFIRTLKTKIYKYMTYIVKKDIQYEKMCISIN